MKRGWIISTLAVVPLIFAGISFYIPTFSEREGVDCAGCHTGYPRLTGQGLEYLAGGYSFDSPPSSESPGFRISGAIESWFVGKNEGRSTDFQLHKFALLSGGRLSKEAYYFAEAYFEERGTAHNLGDIFITLTPWKNVSVRAGQFQPDLVLSDSERLTTRRSLLYDTRVNAWRFRDRQRGLAVILNQDRLTLVGAVVNGNGNGAEIDDVADNNDHKDLSVALSGNPSANTTLGGYLYFGGISDTRDRFRMALNYRQRMLEGRAELNIAAGYGQDDPAVGAGDEQTSLGYFVEWVYALRSDFLILARHDFFDPDNDIDDDHDWDIVPAVCYYMGENIRISGEYAFFKNDSNDEFRAVLSAVF